MPAYLRDIVQKCSFPGCSKTATVELRNGANAVIAPYCDKHGHAKLKEFRAQEEWS